MPNLFPGGGGAGAPLWGRVREAAARALERGALHRIETVCTTLEDGGVRFVVRRVAALARKPEKPEGGPNPFLRPEPDLFVADISDRHYALLNKYNVLDHHLLVLTRRYVDQEVLLDRDDFEALVSCMEGVETLGFYNGGRIAGASQPHKHLQVVPLPLAPGASGVPMEAVLGDTGARSGTRVEGLPFDHAFVRHDALDAAVLHEAYRGLLRACGIGTTLREGMEWQARPYNLLVTRAWMLLVPRGREHVEGISVNALGFAGSLFVPDAERLRSVERLGPMNVLRGVALT